MNYQVLDVKVKDTEETRKIIHVFSGQFTVKLIRNRVRPVIVICPGGGYGMGVRA